MRLKRKDVKRKKLMENVVKNISRKIVKRHVDTAVSDSYYHNIYLSNVLNTMLYNWTHLIN